MNRIYKHLAKCHCWDSAGSAGTAGNGSVGGGGGGNGWGSTSGYGGGEGEGDSSSTDNSSVGGLSDGTYGGMNSPTGGFTSGQASAPGLGFGGMYGGGAYGNAYSSAVSAFGLSNSVSADPALSAALNRAGIDPAAYSIHNMGDLDRTIGLGNTVEGQIVSSNISPTVRQRMQAAIFGQNFTPSTQGLADAIGLGATQSDLTRGYNSGVLGSNDQGDVTADTFGQLSAAFAPALSVLGLGPFGLAKMGLMAALGAPLSNIGPTPGVTGPMGVLGVVKSAYSNYGDLAAASRALGLRGGYGEAQTDISRASALAGTPGGPTQGAGSDGFPTTAASIGMSSPLARAVAQNQTGWSAPNAGWNGGVVNFSRMYG